MHQLRRNTGQNLLHGFLAKITLPSQTILTNIILLHFSKVSVKSTYASFNNTSCLVSRAFMLQTSTIKNRRVSIQAQLGEKRCCYKGDISTKSIKRNKGVTHIPIWKFLLDNENSSQGNALYCSLSIMTLLTLFQKIR